MSVGTLFRQAREARHMSLRSLARHLGISPSYLSDIELDRRIPAEELLTVLCWNLGLSANEIMAQAGRLGTLGETYLAAHPAAILLVRQLAHQNMSEPDLYALLTTIEKGTTHD